MHPGEFLLDHALPWIILCGSLPRMHDMNLAGYSHFPQIVGCEDSDDIPDRINGIEFLRIFVEAASCRFMRRTAASTTFLRLSQWHSPDWMIKGKKSGFRTMCSDPENCRRS